MTNLSSRRMMLAGLGALLAALPAASSLAAEKAQEGPPAVARVVIYPDRALVTRVLKIDCAKGPVRAVFQNLPYGLDPTTLKAAAQGAEAQVEGVSLYQRVLAEAQTEQLRALDARIEALLIEMQEQQRVRERALAQRSQTESLRNAVVPVLNREAAAEKKPNLAAWTTALDVTRELQEEADDRRRTADASLRDLTRQRQELQAQRGALASTAPRRVQDAELMVRCGASGPSRVELSYMTGGVSWEPLYEARAAAAHNALDLSVLASIVQATGEAWKDVEVTLSTATTRRDATPPQLQRLYLGATPEEQDKKVLVRRDEEMSRVTATTPVGSPGNAEAAVEAEDQGLSVQLKVPGTVDFPGDGRPTRVNVETLKLAASFKLLTLPKLLPHAFRSAEAQNVARYPLIPGRVDLFSAGSFIGSSRLPLVARGDKIKLAFGIDEQVKVRRIVVEELKKDPGVLGNTRKLTYAYKIELASYAAKPTEVTLQEQVPVSQMDDVKVVIDPKTTPGYELAKEEGFLTWKVSVAPKEKKLVELRFAVEVPAKYDSSGL
ncbi:MAG: mucoidy inhibitor MuiA family protein [Deltaproteobacteria bacterium]|nr:mucoidy inhibitor MuiA family protein [Deltaproteobacteria bacterium]